MGKVGEFKEKNRTNKDAGDHINALAEGVQTLAWLTVDLTPAPFAKDAAGSAKFWTNKILKNFRGKNETHVEWVNHLTGFLDGFEGYIKQFHMTGLAWGSGLGGATRPAASAAASSGSAGGAEADFAALISEHVEQMAAAAKQLGGVVAEAAAAFVKAAQAEKDLIGKAKTQKKPNDSGLQTLLGPLSTLMSEAAAFKEKHPKDANAWHLTALAEASQVFGWVTVEPTPGPFAKEMIGGTEFWTNKILKDKRGVAGGEPHVNFVNGLTGFLKALPGYILAHHTTGITWAK